MVHRRPLLVALLALAVLPPSAGAFTVGISDQHAEMFASPLFAPLHIRYARLVVPWNVAIKRTWATQVTDQWLFGAALDHVEPHIAFSSPDYATYYKDHPPSPRQYLAAFQAFHRRWPQVRVFTPWNEENFYYQPTATRPALAARYYETVVKLCRGCTVVAADLLDQANLPSWVASFRQALGRRSPRLWGLHNYQDVNRRRSLKNSWTLRYAKLVKGQIWVTEGGGIVGLRSPANGRTVYPYSPTRAAASLRYFFQLLHEPAVRKRYDRGYVYCFFGAWSAHEQTNRWDSGLLGLDGKPRPAYAVLQQLAGRQHPAPAKGRKPGKGPKPGKGSKPGKGPKPAKGPKTGDGPATPSGQTPPPVKHQS